MLDYIPCIVLIDNVCVLRLCDINKIVTNGSDIVRIVL